MGELPRQVFGTVETPKGRAVAMICTDADQPNQAMISWWGVPNEPPKAVLANAVETQPDEFEITPVTFFVRADTGATIIPPLGGDDLHRLHSTRATLRVRGETVEGSWNDADGRSGKITVRPIEANGGVRHVEHCATWGEFKAWAARVRTDGNASAFRGHGDKRFQLRTTLARVGRTRIDRYNWETLHQFHSHVEAVLGRRIDISDSLERSVLLGLAQHHGLPSPLLDWTNSAYIAAFFAFSDALDRSILKNDASHVRIYALTGEFFDRFTPNQVVLPQLEPYVSSLQVSGRGNPRLYAQQGRFLVTNVTEVENFIRGLEDRLNATFMLAADVPIDSTSEALQDLQFMGLSAATLFPGIDGVCRMMRQQMSFRNPPVPPTEKPVDSDARLQASASEMPH